MADAILHIKDAYFFEVPKVLWSPKYERLEDIPNHLAFMKCEDVYNLDDPSFDLGRRATRLSKEKATDPKAEKEYNKLLETYNEALAGKVLIPQLPGVRLKNFYEQANNSYVPAVSKYMLIELVVAVILFAVFTQYAKRVQSGALPKGRFWNLIDVFLLFLRDQVVRPAIGEHGADKFLPFIFTMFFFILGCNLAGMLPWSGSPTAEFGVTLALAAVTLCVSVGSGVQVFGPVGFVLNQAPELGILPFNWMSPLLFVIKVVLLAIEMLGLLIKHGVLAVRLLANIVAGHLVLTAIIGIAASAGMLPILNWLPAAVIVTIGSALLSVLELFVAFLQAYVFCFLASLFIGAAIHHH